jgi:hypothetical protein
VISKSSSSRPPVLLVKKEPVFTSALRIVIILLAAASAAAARPPMPVHPQDVTARHAAVTRELGHARATAMGFVFDARHSRSVT